jgi:hypothetical protein
MTREDIIKMAEEAGLAHFYDSESQCTGVTDDDLVTKEKDRNDDRLVEILMPFAKLVAEHEREKCMKAIEDEVKEWDREAKESALEAAEAIRGEK